MRTGDLLGSGTISGASFDQSIDADSGDEPLPSPYGSLLELTQNGSRTLRLASSNITRAFLEDGDEVILRGTAGCLETGFIGFGDCRGIVLPALQPHKAIDS